MLDATSPDRAESPTPFTICERVTIPKPVRLDTHLQACLDKMCKSRCIQYCCGHFMVFPISVCRGTFPYGPASSNTRDFPACSGTRQAYQHTIVSKQECGMCSLEHAKARHILDHKALELRVQELEFEARVAETNLNDHQLVYDTGLPDDKNDLQYSSTDTTTTHVTLAEQERYNSILTELAKAKNNLAYFQARALAVSFMLERSYPASPMPKAYHRPSICQNRNPGPSSLRFELEPEDIFIPERERLPSKHYNKQDSAVDLHSDSIGAEHIERLEEDEYYLDAGIEETIPGLNLQEECTDDEFVPYDDESEGTKNLVTGWPENEDVSRETSEANEIWTEAITEMEERSEIAWVGLPLRAGCSEQARKAFGEIEVVGLGVEF